MGVYVLGTYAVRDRTMARPQIPDAIVGKVYDQFEKQHDYEAKSFQEAISGVLGPSQQNVESQLESMIQHVGPRDIKMEGMKHNGSVAVLELGPTYESFTINFEVGAYVLDGEEVEDFPDYPPGVIHTIYRMQGDAGCGPFIVEASNDLDPDEVEIDVVTERYDEAGHLMEELTAE